MKPKKFNCKSKISKHFRNLRKKEYIYMAVYKTRPWYSFFWSKKFKKTRPSNPVRAGKVNKTRPYLFIYIFNLSDELESA